MDTRAIFHDAFGRVRSASASAVEGLDADALAWRPDDEANSIGWLVWHLARVQDHHLSQLAGREQVWVTGGWSDRFGTDPDPENIGYGHTPAEVAAVRPDGPGVLMAYLDAVLERTAGFLDTVTPEYLDEIVDERWDPPVSAGVRIVSVVNDSLQHAGQANYVRGMWERLD